MKKIFKKTKQHMRVVAGKIKGKLIECPDGVIRPMTAMVKKSLFDIIKGCEGLKMLDLFSGSANISIEAFSRGLNDADIVEMDRGKKSIIEKNLKNAGFDNANLIFTDALSYCSGCNKKYDFIMMDPPFNWDKKEELLKIISDNNLLEDDGFLVLHVKKKEKYDDKIANLIQYDKRVYGINMLLFYKKVINYC